MAWYVLDECMIFEVPNVDCVVGIEEEQRNPSLMDNIVHSAPISDMSVEHRYWLKNMFISSMYSGGVCVFSLFVQVYFYFV